MKGNTMTDAQERPATTRRAAIPTTGLPAQNEHGLYAAPGVQSYGLVEPAVIESELVIEKEGFLSLGVRRVLYLAGLAGAALAPVLAVTHPEYAAGIVAGSGVLTAAALGTALANPSR